MQHADGELAWVETDKIPLHDAKSNIIGILGTYEDITERKLAEEALRKQAALIDLSPDAIIIHQLDGTITFWSKGA